MTHIISFSLYGNNPLYTLGAIENARLCALAYPGWRIVFYTHSSVPSRVLGSLRMFGATVCPVETTHLDERETIAKCTFWRFLAVHQPDAECVVFRDCDSRVSEREAACVKEWMVSGADFHMMYDHPYHTAPIMAGMWGCRASSLPRLQQEIEAYITENDGKLRWDRYYDQRFLKDIIWERYIRVGTYIAHGEEANCQYHVNLGIRISPYTIGRSFYPSGSHKQEYVGQTIVCPYAREKPERFPKAEETSTTKNLNSSLKE